ncbi:M48 family metalloprotease [Rhodococcus sp. 3Y1]
MAYSVAGKPGFVVATQGLSSALSGGERDAVLAHERAHLSGGHHRIVGACEVLAAVLPRVPLFAAAPLPSARSSNCRRTDTPLASPARLRCVPPLPWCRNRRFLSRTGA